MFSNVISNLLSNAVKFTKRGSINVRLYRENESAVIEITDTGIGIPEDSIEKIFEPFRQGSEGYNRGFEGTGLGLTLTKKCLDVLNGIITVKSKKDEGSVFTIKLPINLKIENE
jgi:signal transduction histidine kinase